MLGDHVEGFDKTQTKIRAEFSQMQASDRSCKEYKMHVIRRKFSTETQTKRYGKERGGKQAKERDTIHDSISQPSPMLRCPKHFP